MIKLTRINNTTICINEDHIDFMEETPDTVITFVNEKKIIVLEKIDEINDKIIEYKRKIFVKYLESSEGE